VADLKLYPQVIEMYALLKEKLSVTNYKAAIDALKNSSRTAYYKPEYIPRAIFAAMKKHAFFRNCCMSQLPERA
jgi:hypothetical protein